MEYEIKDWPGYYLYINGLEIKVFTSWGFQLGTPKGEARPRVIMPGKRKELKQNKTKYGYLRVDLGGQKNKKTIHLHRIIAETLIPNPNNLECVDHIDGNKLNNNISNLQWINRGDNVRKAQTMGRWGTPPKTYELTYETGDVIAVTNISEFSRNNRYQATKLVAISKGKRKSHKDIIRVIEL
jgi:hypothetical protein